MLNIFKSYSAKTCLLDDFEFYEKREKLLRSGRSSKNTIPEPEVYGYDTIPEPEVYSYDNYQVSSIFVVLNDSLNHLCNWSIRRYVNCSTRSCNICNAMLLN